VRTNPQDVEGHLTLKKTVAWFSIRLVIGFGSLTKLYQNTLKVGIHSFPTLKSGAVCK